MKLSLLEVVVLELHIVPGRVFEPGSLLLGQGAHALRRTAEPEVAALELLALGDEAAGAEEDAAPQDRAAGDDGVAAADGFVRMRDVDHGPVLDAGARADADVIHIAAHRAHGPDRG